VGLPCEIFTINREKHFIQNKKSLFSSLKKTAHSFFCSNYGKNKVQAKVDMNHPEKTLFLLKLKHIQ